MKHPGKPCAAVAELVSSGKVRETLNGCLRAATEGEPAQLWLGFPDNVQRAVGFSLHDDLTWGRDAFNIGEALCDYVPHLSRGCTVTLHVYPLTGTDPPSWGDCGVIAARIRLDLLDDLDEQPNFRPVRQLLLESKGRAAVVEAFGMDERDIIVIFPDDSSLRATAESYDATVQEVGRSTDSLEQLMASTNTALACRNCRLLPRFVACLGIYVPARLSGSFTSEKRGPKSFYFHKPPIAITDDRGAPIIGEMDLLSTWLRIRSGRLDEALGAVSSLMISDTTLRIVVASSPARLETMCQDIQRATGLPSASVIDRRIVVGSDDDWSHLDILRESKPFAACAVVLDTTCAEEFMDKWGSPYRSRPLIPLYTTAVALAVPTTEIGGFLHKTIRNAIHMVPGVVGVFLSGLPHPEIPRGAYLEDERLHQFIDVVRDASSMAPTRELHRLAQLWLEGGGVPPPWQLVESGYIAKRHIFGRIKQRIEGALLQVEGGSIPVVQDVQLAPTAAGAGTTSALRRIAYDLRDSTTVRWLSRVPHEDSVRQELMDAIVAHVNRGSQLILVIDDKNDAWTTNAEIDTQGIAGRGSRIRFAESLLRRAREQITNGSFVVLRAVLTEHRNAAAGVLRFPLSPFLETADVSKFCDALQNAYPGDQAKEALELATNVLRRDDHDDFDRHIYVFILTASRGQHTRPREYIRRCYEELTVPSLETTRVTQMIRVLAFVRAFAPWDIGVPAKLAWLLQNAAEECPHVYHSLMKRVGVNIRFAHPFLAQLWLENEPCGFCFAHDGHQRLDALEEAWKWIATEDNLLPEVKSRFGRAILSDREVGHDLSAFLEDFTAQDGLERLSQLLRENSIEWVPEQVGLSRAYRHSSYRRKRAGDAGGAVEHAREAVKHAREAKNSAEGSLHRMALSNCLEAECIDACLAHDERALDEACEGFEELASEENEERQATRYRSRVRAWRRQFDELQRDGGEAPRRLVRHARDPWVVRSERESDLAP